MKRVLMVADGAWPTGFERVARGIGTYLHGTGQYEVIHRAIGYGPREKLRVAPYPYELKPAHQSADDPMAYGQVGRWIKEDKPDVILMIQDLWNQTNYVARVPRTVPTVGYYPVDTPNLKWNYCLGAAALTDAVPYTEFGAVETALGTRSAVDVILSGYAAQGIPLNQKATWLTLPKDGLELHMRVDRLAARQNPDALRPIAHGIDHGLFAPADRAMCRKLWGLPQDAFVVLNVNTNQFRKRQDLTIRAFAQVAAAVPNAYLVLHCMGKDSNGWDLAQLGQLYGVQDRMICTHWAYPELTDEQLVALYNSADVQINTGGGEGFGLTAVEGALCGVAQLTPDWSATRELWAGSGVLLPVSDYRFEPKYINTAHAIIDTKATARLLIDLAQHPDTVATIGATCRERALRLPSWPDVGQAFAERIAGALEDQPVTPMTLADIRDVRHAELESELLRFDK